MLYQHPIQPLPRTLDQCPKLLAWPLVTLRRPDSMCVLDKNFAVAVIPSGQVWHELIVDPP